MSEYRYVDTKRADGTYVTFRKIVDDRYDMDFKPRDKHEAKMIRSGEWIVVSVKAAADILIVCNHVGTMHTMTSAGIHGVVVERMDDPYVTELFVEECEALRCDMTAMARWKEAA